MAKDLDNLISGADETTASPRMLPAGTLAERVRQRVATRRSRRCAAGITAVLALAVMAGLGTWNQWPHRGNPLTVAGGSVGAKVEEPAALDVVQVRAQLAALDREVGRHQEIVRQLELSEARRRTEALGIHGPDPMERIDQQADRAALIFFAQGQQFEDELNLKSAAVQAYRQTAAIFPRSSWGAAARARLASLGG